MAALTASLERANITSSTDQSISASDLARDTALTNNHDEAVATVNITLIITMVCVSGYWCYNNDRNNRRVTAQEEQNSS